MNNLLRIKPHNTDQTESRLDPLFLEQLDVDFCKITVFIGVCGHADESFIRRCHVNMGISKLEIF